MTGDKNKAVDRPLVWYPIESKWVVYAAIAAFLAAVLLTDGGLGAGFAALGVVAGAGWAVRRLSGRRLY